MRPGKIYMLQKFYKAFWKWHFYAGIITTPTLIIVSLTGALYVYQDNFRHYTKPFLFQKPDANKPILNFTDLTKAAEKHIAKLSKDNQLTVIDISKNRKIVRLRYLTKDKKTKFMTLDHNTGEVLKNQGEEKDIFDIAIALHSSLYLGKFGRFLVEISTSWAMILILTGILLWWPVKTTDSEGNTSRRVRGVYTIRFKGNKYVTYRDLHTVPGFYFSILMALVALTGLVFTLLFGTAFRVGTLMLDPALKPFMNPPKSRVVMTNEAQRQKVYSIINTHIEQNFDKDYFTRVTFPQKPDASISVLAFKRNLGSDTKFRIFDQYSGEILDKIDIENVRMFSKILVYALPIHIGTILGEPTKALALITCLMITWMCISGIIMWFKRKKEGSWGFPKSKKLEKSKSLSVTIAILGIVFPAFGLSLIMAVFINLIYKKIRKESNPTAPNTQ